MTKVISVDPGFERLGVAVLKKEDGEERLLHSDCIRTSARDTLADRLADIHAAVENIITEHKPEILAIETLFFNTNQKTAMAVAEARGTVITAAKNKGLAVYEYTPLEIKTAVAGYGRAPKEQVAAMVKTLLSLPEGTKKLDDEYDAIAVGLAHFAIHR